MTICSKWLAGAGYNQMKISMGQMCDVYGNVVRNIFNEVVKNRIEYSIVHHEDNINKYDVQS